MQCHNIIEERYLNGEVDNSYYNGKLLYYLTHYCLVKRELFSFSIFLKDWIYIFLAENCFWSIYEERVGPPRTAAPLTKCIYQSKLNKKILRYCVWCRKLDFSHSLHSETYTLKYTLFEFIAGYKNRVFIYYYLYTGKKRQNK